MTFPAGSLEDVEAWANAEFPAYFAAVKEFFEDCPVELTRFDGEFTDGKTILRPILVRTLPIGYMAKMSDLIVYARLLGNNDVEIFCEATYNSLQEYEKRELCYIEPITDITEIGLEEPWSCPIETKYPAGLDRLETLIRYFFLKDGHKTAVEPKLGFFKTHFRAACRDVARGKGAVDEADEMEDDETLPDDTPPDLIADTDIAGLRDNPAATAIFRQHVHNMDESYHDFKTGMLRQLAAVQAMDQNNLAQVQAQNQELERRLVLSEEARATLEKQLETKNAEAKAATEDATSWKTQYEGLKQLLQGALGQRF